MLSIGSKASAIHLAASHSPAALTRLNSWAYASFNSFSVAAALPADDLLVKVDQSNSDILADPHPNLDEEG